MESVARKHERQRMDVLAGQQAIQDCVAQMVGRCSGGQAHPGIVLDLGKQALDVFLYQSLQRRLLRSPALVVVYSRSWRRRVNRFVHRP